jgi:3-deoxy-7-phosphoheptulonate synthase
LLRFCVREQQWNTVMAYSTDNLRIRSTQVVLAPSFLHEKLPITDIASTTVFCARNQISRILHGEDDRLLVIAGPCSIHDTKAAYEYAHLLKAVVDQHSNELMIVMRVYFEKPRTTIGWKGLINDPYLDQTYNVNDGLRMARHLLLELATIGIPAGTECLDLITPQYTMDLISWAAIGARTTESQVHRQMASGLSCPVGFKNGTSGDEQIAIEAIQVAAHPHSFLAHNKEGQLAIFGTTGNRDCHIVLRGGRRTVNYTAARLHHVCSMLEASGLPARVMVDCSHANSNKDHTKQPGVCRNVMEQIAAGDDRIFGVMLESHLVAGSQRLIPGQKLIYGQSITDACIGWDETQLLLQELAEAVRTRRHRSLHISNGALRSRRGVNHEEHGAEKHQRSAGIAAS